MKFCEPVNATSPSTTTSLRWLRRSGRCHLPLNGCTGSIGCQSTPILVNRFFIFLYPTERQQAMWSNSTRTMTPRPVGLLERAEQRLGRVVERQDVELDVDVLRRLADLVGHRHERFLVVRVEVRIVAADERHRAEVAVELHDRFEVGRPRVLATHLVDAVGGLQDVVVDLPLLLAAALGQLAAAEQEEDQTADDRRPEDQQQPGHARLRPAIAGHHDERGDADGEVDQGEDADDRDVEIERHVVSTRRAYRRVR